jgi:hypothetical protein
MRCPEGEDSDNDNKANHMSSKRQTQRSVTELTVPRTGKPQKAEIVVSVCQGAASIVWDSGFRPGEAGFSVFQELLEGDPRTIEISYRLRAHCVRVVMTRQQERLQVSASDAAWLVSVLSDIFATATAKYERMRGKVSFGAEPVADAQPAPLLESRSSPDRPAPKVTKDGLRISMEAGSD